MKKESYALRYNAIVVWLLTLPLLAVLGWNVWFSGMPLIYARNVADLIDHHLPADFAYQTLLADVMEHGYSKQLLSQHTHKAHSSGCNPCHCPGGSCGCCLSHKVVVDPFTLREFLFADTIMAALLLPLLGYVNGPLTRLTLTPKQISFPYYILASLILTNGLFPRSLVTAKRWSEIFSISLVHPDGADDLDEEEALKATRIAFDFPHGRVLKLTLGKFSDSDLKLFFTAIINWAEQRTLTQEVLTLIERHLNPRTDEPNEQKDLSFTSMWQEELGSHMAATTFVPLAKGAPIQSGRLKVIALLASGGLSAVYLAETFDRKMVILKESVVPQHVDEKTKEKAQELFEREARLLLKLEHPQIARVVDHVHESGRDYLVLEYIPGQSLRQVVKRSGPQDEQTVLRWTGEIANILGYLHGLEPPIIHRDLTPDNLVLKDDGTVALIDFGAANEYVGAATGTLIGKQAYMSPEQFRGKASPASDIYALGGTLHFLLTGQDPEALSVSHPRVQRPDLSPDIDNFVSMCTEEEEDSRLASISELKKKLAELPGAKDRAEQTP
jgi:tRNA A-37 threonylcarbamoyl transferase component Bud32